MSLYLYLSIGISVLTNVRSALPNSISTIIRLSSSLRLIYQLLILFYIEIKHRMRTIIPFVLGIGMDTEILPQVEALLHKWISILLKVIVF